MSFGNFLHRSGIATTCPSCRADFCQVFVLDNQGETIQTIMFQQRRPQEDEDEDEESEEEDDESELSGNEEEAEGGEEFVQFLDDFVVPDGTIEFEDDAASLPSPSQLAGEGRSRRSRMREEEVSDEDDEEVQVVAVQGESAVSSRRSRLDFLVAQRRRYFFYSTSILVLMM